MSNSEILNKYLRKLTSLKQGVTTYGKAPHKPILLISIIDLISQGKINENRIYVDTDLVATFQENWKLLVNTLHLPDFTQPFYYLQSDKIEGEQLWFLQPKPGFQIDAPIKSVIRLSQVLEYAFLSPDLYQIVTNPATRSVIRTALIDAYFPRTKTNYIQSKEKGIGYIHDLEKYLLNEPEAQYKQLKIESEEDVFVRGGLFKKLVPKVYDSTCSFTGMRLESTFGYNFIDACHIVPFSVSRDDKVNNGIALCPNLHRAFDRGLISIDNSYRLIISSHIAEVEGHPYSLRNLEGRKMRLPFNSRYYPSLENLDWHRKEIFKG